MAVLMVLCFASLSIKRDNCKSEPFGSRPPSCATNAIIAVENFNYYLVAGHRQDSVNAVAFLLTKCAQLIPTGKS